MDTKRGYVKIKPVVGQLKRMCDNRKFVCFDAVPIGISSGTLRTPWLEFVGHADKDGMCKVIVVRWLGMMAYGPAGVETEIGDAIADGPYPEVGLNVDACAEIP